MNVTVGKQLPADWLSSRKLKVQDALNGNGTDNTFTIGAQLGGGGTSTNCVTYTNPQWYGYYGYRYPVTLKLSEVEKLRAAAKKDKKLKDILTKFTGHIQIEVDFD